VARRKKDTVDANELAQKMLEWGEKHLELALLTAEIESAVLEIGKTQNVGNVRASYSKGRKSYRYNEAGQTAPPATIEQHTKIVTTHSVDWKGICQAANIKDIPFTQGEPSVKVKVVA